MIFSPLERGQGYVRNHFVDDCHTPLPLSRGDGASADARSHPEGGSDSGEHSDDDAQYFAPNAFVSHELTNDS